MLTEHQIAEYLVEDIQKRFDAAFKKYKIGAAKRGKKKSTGKLLKSTQEVTIDMSGDKLQRIILQYLHYGDFVNYGDAPFAARKPKPWKSKNVAWLTNRVTERLAERYGLKGEEILKAIPQVITAKL
ncbi:hypothetical protein V6R21_07795 [Limibacter armeniacum]|uniref:hypothetical protein n=1 Tax=Limibacter armeniacum TaxID=466084 RepID=UPI002FE55A4E